MYADHVPKPKVPPAISAEISNQIRGEIGRQGITATELARKIDQEFHWISRRLRVGAVTPWTVDDVNAIAEALGVPVSQLWRKPWEPPTTKAKGG